ncbi:MAG: hypothetical protein V2I33_17220 [Kangiellaceae bacterium]|jgi:hypothetical protein|nr:hypothetical protein [Kangiellaceae bacterium]
MADAGSIGEFVEGKDEWLEYQERLEQTFIAKDVTDEKKKKAILLSTCGRDAFRLIKKLLQPKEIAEASYRDVCSALSSHFSPKASEILERFRFSTRDRRSGEPICDFVAELRHLSKNCNFGSSLCKMMRDRLVLGINDKELQQRLLEESNLTFESALEKCQAFEAARKNAREILSTESSTEAQAEAVQRMQHMRQSQKPKNDKWEMRQQRQQQPCYRCLSSSHQPQKCPFKSKTCFRCGKQGHTAKACKSPAKGEAMRLADSDTDSNSDTDANITYHLYRLKSSSRVPPITASVRINNRELRMEVDTGSSLTLVSSKTFERQIGSLQDLQKTSLKVRTYSGEPLPVLGSICVRVETRDGLDADLQLTVVDGDGPSLLSRDCSSCRR